MAVDIEKAFNATSQSSKTFLITSGQGCYIPAYQRPYSWKKSDVDRLFEDLVNGVSSLRNREDAVHFVGSVIAVHDTEHKFVVPRMHSEMPAKVMTIVDGQQRISTIIMMNVAIHNLVSNLSSKLTKRKERQFEWIVDQAKVLLGQTSKTFIIDMETGEGNYRYYPRLARSYEDVWSKRKLEAKYKSPITRLIWEYFNFLTDENTTLFKYDPKGTNGETIEHYKVAVEIFRHIQKSVRDITGAKADLNDFSGLMEIVDAGSIGKALWGRDLESDVVAFVRDQIEDPDYEKFSQLLRVIVLSKYLTDRVAFTVVTAASEDDAFDAFEALNTTGEPLTAFETFKPIVIAAEGMEDYEQSESFKHIKIIEIFLEKYMNAEEKQKETTNMLLPFALAETGYRLPKHLSDQRRYLRSQFRHEQLKDIEKKRAFIRRMADVSEFLQLTWKNAEVGNLKFRSNKRIDDQTQVGLEVLRDLQHHIVVAPLSRFYGALREALPDQIDAKEKELISAIQATVAFSVLWRAARGGATGIDARYRAVLADKIDNKYGPLAARSDKGTGSVSLVNYKKALKYLLKEVEIDNKEDWLKSVVRQPIYEQKVISRYLLFLASHDSDVDSENLGLIKAGRDGILELLTPAKWKEDEHLTIEHIVPQKNSKGDDWEKDLYEEPETVNKLGNLTLLPRHENSVAGNRKWEHKRAVYKLLASSNRQEFDKNLETCKKLGLTLSLKAREVLDNAKFLPMCASLSPEGRELDTRIH